MKLTTNKLNSAVNNRVLIVYGDAGVSNQTINQLLSLYKKQQPQLVTKRYIYNEINVKLEQFTADIFNLNLGGEINLHLIKQTPASINNNWQQLLTEIAANSPHFVVLQADELTPSSSLRKFCEKAGNIAIMPCYRLNESQQRQHLMAKFTELNIKANSQVIDLLVGKLPLDPGIINCELNKIYHWLLANNSNMVLDLATAQQLTSTNAENNFDRMLSGLTRNNAAKICQQFIELAAGNNAVGVIRMLIRHILRLQQVAAECSNGNSFEQAITTLKPPLFFTMKTSFSRQLQASSYQKICRLLHYLYHAELELKTGNLSHEVILGQLGVVINKCFRR
ncbi:MAG: DNA polymerase III subunit delta [Pseudomonadota bacterium]